ncbi:MAG: hypothetical protein P8L18_08455 [Verrucomicrobiota bacterium]|jgi:exodeoxyribonuclease III|nr:hypothetical protein [Verrucomicrobiota bacterium]
MKTGLLALFSSAVLTLALCAENVSTESSIKIVNWNVLYGFNHGQALEAGSRWIAEQAPDIVALQELNGLSVEQLGHHARSWDHAHAVMHKESGFPVGLTSNRPVEVLERVVKGGHHGYLHCKTRGVHFFVVHFWPGQFFEPDRVTETSRLLLSRKERIIILGDFNGCSRRDAHFLKTHATGRMPDFSFVDQVESLGFVDMIHKHDPLAKVSCPSPITIPRWSRDLAELKTKQYRIDFVFADPQLAQGSESGTLLLEPVINTISDHYPVVVVFNAASWPD